MIIGIPRESLPGETRVAATPQTVGQLIKLGYEVLIETGAGAASSFADGAYTEAGAGVGSADQVWVADVVLKVNAPNDEEIAALRDGATLISLISRAEAGTRRAAGQPSDHGARHGRRSAYFPGPVAGRVVVDGEHRGLPRRHRSRQ
jgi:alanine dehydrogenase